MKSYLKVIAIDFDGVIHKHCAPWTAPHEINDGVVDGAFEFIEQVLLTGFDVVVFSARAREPIANAAIGRWLVKHWTNSGRDPRLLENSGVTVTATKPHAFIYIDDRGWHFKGTFPTLDELRAFESWTKSAGEPPLKEEGI
jgi:hypothetical protein